MIAKKFLYILFEDKGPPRALENSRFSVKNLPNTHNFSCIFVAKIFSLPYFLLQAAPAGIVYGVNAAGCLVGPSGEVCPTGNVQYT